MEVKAWTSGIIGACSLNLLHETARNLIPNAPHVDQIAMRAIGIPLQKLGITLSLQTLRKVALGGDLISNSLYYSAIGGLVRPQSLQSVWKRAWILGIAAGVGAVALPPRMGLGQQPSRNFPLAAALTVAWYVSGALISAQAYSMMLRSQNKNDPSQSDFAHQRAA